MLNIINHQENANQNHNETLPCICQDGYYTKKTTNSSCWQSFEGKGPFRHCLWECKLLQSLWNTLWIFLKNLQIELPYHPAIPFVSTDSKITKTFIWKDRCTPMFVASLLQTSRIWKQAKCPSTDYGQDVVHTQWSITQL